MSQKTIYVVNKLNQLQEAIIAETPSTGQIRIEWSGDPAAPHSEPVTFAAGEVLTLRIENGAVATFNNFGYVQFPAWAEFDFKGSQTCPGGLEPQIIATRSAVDTKITIKKGKADYLLDLWFSELTVAVPRAGQENVNIGDDQT
ncbi:MAG: hypothetical protein MUF15_19860 [Acidobacteria bacterium]|jgi:hypothetical protein|nr:hypothetical protein [Acidobacteriota bacterium]